ncbi:universal stress protein [Jatrophihabitans telluris]|uniref:Universal stress protein n=1 Tax=Jatrophihabitans telluris TaxID=2038343 RepID=A0ABY4R1E8_9ACTN|nr:universal stress protein [Jatrophihabitans telluris]UQX88950.1 universal stress protein [Jatrophihabitans telluris]
MTVPQSQHTLLVGIDGGPGSGAVLQSAARLAELVHGQLLIAHIVETPQVVGGGYAGIGIGLDESALTDVEAVLFPEVVEAMAESAVSWRLMALTGNPATELVRIADQQRVSAIVVGADTPGWTSHLRRLSSGSVPTRLAHEQRAPVVIVPAGCSRSRHRDNPQTLQA